MLDPLTDEYKSTAHVENPLFVDIQKRPTTFKE
jgi:hypothetical protein